MRSAAMKAMIGRGSSRLSPWSASSEAAAVGVRPRGAFGAQRAQRVRRQQREEESDVRVIAM
jgi:hypothetical protein